MSLKKVFGCGRCAERRGEQLAVWVGVGVVFLTLLVTSVFGPARAEKAATPEQRVVRTATPVEATLAPERVSAHLASFDIIWRTIRERHWDLEHLEAVGWEAARDELRPMVEEADSDDEALGVMSELLDRMRLSHYQIIPSEVYDEQERAGGEGMTGISVRVLDGEAVVFRVDPDSPGAEAGVEPGWVVESIGEREAAEILERAREREEITGDRPGVFSSMMIEGRLRGAVGETLAVGFRDRADEPREVEMVLARSADPLFEAANLPPMPVRIRSERIGGAENGVGYFTFSAFMDPVRLMPEFERAVEASRELDGLVIDLRGNMGGIIAMCNGIGGWLLTDTASAELGRLSMRSSDLKLVMNRRARPLRRPVAVLIDERSISSAEILAGGLQDTRVARVFGSTSAGMSLPSIVEELPNGDSFQYAFSNYVSASGRELEKNGVEPDEVVRLTRDDLIAGRDPALEAAVEWIRSRPE